MDDEGFQPDFFAPAVATAEDAARPVGAIDGPARWHEGFGAGLRVWCGWRIGWRPLGDLLSPDRGTVSCHAGAIVFHEGRLQVSLSFDLGAHSIPRRPSLANGEPTDADAEDRSPEARDDHDGPNPGA